VSQNKHHRNIKTSAVLKAFFRLFYAYSFYPVMIALFVWFYIQKAHWGFGLAVIIAILLFDPLWGLMGRNIRRLMQRDKH